MCGMTDLSIAEPCGVLCIDKPAGMTSFDVVAQVRRCYKTKKVGHTGTLDPMATGVLVVLVGRAAKAAEYLTADSKVYLAQLQLGLTTDTQDSTGKVLSQTKDLPTEAKVKAAAEKFLGVQQQVPPMYSALKVNGQKLVDLARQGIEVERKSREIEITKLELQAIDPKQGQYEMEVGCSKGTYIRTLCADLGDALGCGGVMAGLRRLESGNFSLAQAVSFAELTQADPQTLASFLCPLEQLFSDLPKVNLPPFFARLARCGCEVYQKKIGTSYPKGQRVTFWDNGTFFALGQSEEKEGEAVLKPIKQFQG